jgi:hypothetical protein
MDNQVEFLLKLRDGCQMITDAANEFIDSLAHPKQRRKIKLPPSKKSPSYPN